ncbi:MAG: bifunctional diaminohydroxyphosphoribosylaminopyrimidine deaminase/5-amino-6-(5-phosphoribosylamino)uracil reductase RibD [Parvularculaceae bacterium]
MDGHDRHGRFSAAAPDEARLVNEARFMDAALALAARGLGRTSPNPAVGCVIVRNGEIVGRGWHRGPGSPHAEAMALADAGAEARGAVAYVTLEPCNHHGRTGPCAQALIDAGVRGVVYAIPDPNRIAAGGARRLAVHGLGVREGVRADEARDLNRAWLHAVSTGRAYVHAKSAMSLDGRIATGAGESRWITGAEARARGHAYRRDADAILVGADTVVAADPALTHRGAASGDADRPQPLRVVVDSRARVSPGAKVFERTGRGALLACLADVPARRLAAFEELGVDVVRLPKGPDGRPDLRDLTAAVWRRGAARLLVEGGGRLIGALRDADLIDELSVFIAPKIIGGGRPGFDGAGVARLADASRFEFAPPEPLGADVLFHGRRRRDDATEVR